MDYELMRELERKGEIKVSRFRGQINECDTQVSAFIYGGVYWLLIHRRTSGLGIGKNTFGFGRYNVPMVDNQFLSFKTKEEANGHFLKYLWFCKRVDMFDVVKVGNTVVEVM